MELIDDSVQHLGHFVEKFLSLNPNDIAQIDAATGEEETKGALLARSTRLAGSLRRLGLQPGDVLALGGKNHLDVHVPFYAAAFNGLPMAGVDPLYKYDEIKSLFEIIKPKIAFCEPDAYQDFSRAAEDLGTLIVTFRGGEYPMEKFMEDYQDPTPENQFEVATFDIDKVYAWLVSTSGTTGSPKVAAVRHREIMKCMTFFLTKPRHTELRTGLTLSSMQWISACYNALTLPVHHIKLQTSAPVTPEHVANLINKYKPRTVSTTPTLLSQVLKTDCDFTCFDFIGMTGSKVSRDLLTLMKSRMRKDAILLPVYAITECVGVLMMPDAATPFGSCGKHTKQYQVKLVDPDTNEIVTKPQVTGELWVKGPRIAEYYNNPKATAEAFTDGWFKTGDLFYRDENDNYTFVDRLKILIKYRNYQISPLEIEDVINEHPEVAGVAASSITHPDDGEHLVACIVRQPGSKVSAQDIKDHVASKLSPHKQIHGGIVFVDRIPMTSSDKVARVKIREFVKTASLE